MIDFKIRFTKHVLVCLSAILPFTASAENLCEVMSKLEGPLTTLTQPKDNTDFFKDFEVDRLFFKMVKDRIPVIHTDVCLGNVYKLPRSKAAGASELMKQALRDLRSINRDMMSDADKYNLDKYILRIDELQDALAGFGARTRR